MKREILNDFILQKEPNTVDTYRPLYHMHPRVGWMNDPNGLIYFKGEYHLYYQSNPLRTRPGQMSWSHFTSPDLISFIDHGVALALEDNRESAYSGGAIESNGEIHILYTLHTEQKYEAERYDGETLDGDEIYTETENEIRKSLPKVIEGEEVKTERIFHSFSLTGESFERGVPVFDNSTLPSYLSRADFRDPNPVKIASSFYMFVGGKDIRTNSGVIIVLKGESLDRFEYDFHIGPYYEFGDMGECPSYRRIGDKDVLLLCGCDVKRKGNDFRNINSAIAIVGNIDFAKKKMDIDFIKELDKGDSFYAPQFIAGEPRPVMIGWLEMWGKHYPTSKLKHGYVGSFSIPRIVSIDSGDLCQNPVDELLSYEREYVGEGLPRQADIELSLPLGSTFIIKGNNGRLTLGNSSRGVYLDNSESNSMYQCARWTNRPYENARLRILLDTSTIEIFVGGGAEVISSRFYIDGPLKTSINGDIKIERISEIRR